MLIGLLGYAWGTASHQTARQRIAVADLKNREVMTPSQKMNVPVQQLHDRLPPGAIEPNAESGLLEYLLHVQDEVGAVARLGHARVRHAVGRHGLLRVRDIGVQRCLRPRDAAALERGGITEVVHLARPPPENSVQARAHPLSSALE